MENLHADISRLITSDSRGKAAVRNHTGAETDSDLHVPAGSLAWLLYEIQMIEMTQFPPSMCDMNKKKVYSQKSKLDF